MIFAEFNFNLRPLLLQMEVTKYMPLSIGIYVMWHFPPCSTTYCGNCKHTTCVSIKRVFSDGIYIAIMLLLKHVQQSHRLHYPGLNY